ncbi:MAG: hypothetical protein QOF42_1112, partial [Gammaproteobacteria bacterium]|nr:hypothetical protein [Gammaproteobacteria bacterium]
MKPLVALGVALSLVACFETLASAQSPPQPSQQDLAAARAACTADIQKLCPGVPAGGGQILACLKQHKEGMSAGCKQAVMKVLQPNGPSALPSNALPGAPAPGSPASSAPAPAPAHSAAAASDKYFLMQQVKIIDQAAGGGRTAYNLMIPTTWTFKGWVNVNAAEYGCFADYFAVAGDAFSADRSIELQFVPQFTFQYYDDPAAQKHVQDQSQLAVRTGMKPCPLRAPMRAADFIRAEIINKYHKDRTFVSAEPFPELEQMTRQRLGLPPLNAAGGNTAPVRTDAARVRVAFNDDKGQSMEQWITAVIVVRTAPQGRGMVYDWHATSIMVMNAPKGKLDGNDRLLKLVASTLRVDPQWQSRSNGVIVGLYKKKAEAEAKESAVIAALQNYAIQTINGVTANQLKGSLNSAYGADQGIRGVQTFRD